jgi:uncharacterized repeat protein (TIGR03803 family)
MLYRICDQSGSARLLFFLAEGKRLASSLLEGEETNMRPLVTSIFAVAFSVAAGCSQQTASMPSSDTAGAVRVRTAVTVSTIYSFQGSPDGSIPEAGLTLFAGKFYGTTTTGGMGRRSEGTIFDVREDGTEQVLHSFSFTPDGSSPESGLTNYHGALYGVTSVGGAKSVGVVYEFKPDSGKERVVYSFQNGMDGATPTGDLTVHYNLLWGTTLFGGQDSAGVVFKVRTDGIEGVVHAFTGTPDGDRPHGGLVEMDDSLYGTTELGGANNLGCVFKIDPDGTERVLYSFKGAGSDDGAAPRAGLTVLNGLLYGVTSRGGGADMGTVFEVRPNGTEKVLYSFKGSDGKFPYAALTPLKDRLYGTTINGGANSFGTLFEIRPDGTFRSLHDFAGTDGAGPDGQLTGATGNALIGTTRRGGDHNKGTVFLVQL